jgi:hypothetical protein
MFSFEKYVKILFKKAAEKFMHQPKHKCMYNILSYGGGKRKSTVRWTTCWT